MLGRYFLKPIWKAIGIIFLFIGLTSYVHSQSINLKLKEFSDGLRNKDFVKSLQLGREILAYAKETDSISLVARAYKLIGNVYSAMDSIGIAEKYYNYGLNHFIENRIEYDIEKCKILYNLSQIYERRKQYNRTIEFLKDSYHGLKYLNFPEFQISDWVTLRLYRYLVNKTEKEKLIVILLDRKEIFQKFHYEKTVEYADLCQSLGTSYLLTEDYYSAIKYYNQSSDILAQLNKYNLDYAFNQTYLGGISMSGGDLISAEIKYKKSLDILDSLLKVDTTLYKNELVQNLYLSNREFLANVYFQLNQYENALEAYQEIKEYYQEEDPDKYLDAVIAISYCYTNLHDREKALAVLENAYSKISDVDSTNAPSYLSCIYWVANLSEYLNKDSQLKNAFDKYENIVLSIYGKNSIEYIDYAQLKCDLLSNAYKKKKAVSFNKSEIEKHIALIEKSFLLPNIKYKHDDSIKVYTNLAKYYTVLGKEEKALALYKKVDTLVNDTRKPINIITRENYIVEEVELLFNRKRYPDAYNRINDFVNFLKQDLSNNSKYLTDIELAQYWPKQLSRLQWALNILISIREHVPKSSKLIYEIVLLTKGYLLNSDISVRDQIIQSGDSLSLNRYFILENINKTISSYISSNNTFQSEIDSVYINDLVIKSDSLKTLLMRNSSAYYTLTPPNKNDIQSIRNKLADSDALIEYFQYTDQFDKKTYYVSILISKKYSDPIVIPLCSYDSIKNTNSTSSYPNLYKLIWAPMEKYLSGIKRIYLSPSSYLNQVSFSALSWSTNGNTKYLIDNYNLIQIESSLRIISASTIDKKLNNKNLALFGGIDYNRYKKSNATGEQTVNNRDTRGVDNDLYFSYLPGTKLEVDSLSTLVNSNAWHSTVFSGLDASENNFKLLFPSQYNIVHVATHGFSFDSVGSWDKPINDETSTTYQTSSNPLIRCGLLFAGANYSLTGLNKKMVNSIGEDGILTAFELSNYNMSNIDLIVLSACGTALGEITSFEGVLGLKRAIAIARAKSAILSVWPVEDKSAQEFMTLFYKELVISNNISEAFFESQRRMKSMYPHDIQKWASFVYQIN